MRNMLLKLKNKTNQLPQNDCNISKFMFRAMLFLLNTSFLTKIFLPTYHIEKFKFY